MSLSYCKKMIVCRRGNFGLMTAILAPVIIGFAGLAIDFSQATLVKTQLQDAADAALLGNVSQKSKIMTAALGGAANGAFEISSDEVEALFKAQAVSNQMATDAKILNISAEKRDGFMVVSATYQAVVPTSLSRIFGKESILVSGTSQVTAPLPSYRDYYVLLDNSPSMGVAATPSDITKMQAKTGKCAFACHMTQKDKPDFYDIARANKIKLRIDLLQLAAHEMIKKAESSRIAATQYRFSLYSLGETISSTKLTLFSAMSYPSHSLSENLAELELMTVRKHGDSDHAGTRLYGAISGLQEEMGSQGTGYGPGSPIKTMIVVTDGVENSYKSNCIKPKVPGSNVCQEPIDNAVCDAAKRKGINIAILYTTYLPLKDDPWWNDWIKPFDPEIGMRLRTCANEGMFIEASFEDDLGQAMTHLFEATLGGSRLTQ